MECLCPIRFQQEIIKVMISWFSGLPRNGPPTPPKSQPCSQGPFSTSRKYFLFLEVEKGPWERGCPRVGYLIRERREPQWQKNGDTVVVVFLSGWLCLWSLTLQNSTLSKKHIKLVWHQTMPVQHELTQNLGYGIGNAICAVCQESFGVDERMVNSNGQILHERCFV